MSMLCDGMEAVGEVVVEAVGEAVSDLFVDAFVSLFEPESTDAMAPFAPEPVRVRPPPLPGGASEALEFDLRTPSRWSALPQLPAAPTVVGLAPHLLVHDADAALAFYERAFGATEAYREAQTDGRIRWVAATVGGVSLVICDDLPELRFGRSSSPAVLGGTPVTLHLTVAGVEAFFLRAVQSGARILQPLQNVGHGRRHGVVEDPFGHRWSLSSA